MKSANELVGGLDCMYTALILEGLYLPKKGSHCINNEYLLQTALNKIVTLKQDVAGHGIPVQK